MTKIIITKEKHEPREIIIAPISETEKFIRMGSYFITTTCETEDGMFASSAIFIKEEKPIKK